MWLCDYYMFFFNVILNVISGFSYDVKNFKDDNVHRPCFCVFDILLFNGRVLTNESLKERLKIMDSLIFDIDGVIMKSKRIITRTK